MSILMSIRSAASALCLLGLLSLSTNLAAQTRPAETLVSPQVLADRKVTFRVKAPKRTPKT